MSNWDLMMPGMGLTAIGLAGVTISYSGIAHTFIDGMHALTGLTMFIGLIFLAAGILDGGVSTSNRAKATTLVILSISLGFGMFALGTMNTSDYTVTLAGLLMAIAFPAILIAYLAMKHSTLTKPIGSIVGIAAATGIIMWLAFGFVSPDTYMIPQQVGVEEPTDDITPAGPIFAIQILEDSAQEGNPDYSPDVAIVTQGYVVEWTNDDSVAHTVTSAVDFGETFDSSLMSAGDVYTLDTTDLEIGEYEYLCIVHPWMVATLVIEEPKEPVRV
ncbi:MAG: copper-binding protein, partial [Nitrosopumilus sp.]|nr:copper-binding protein [Nitrosopumilus sp.]